MMVFLQHRVLRRKVQFGLANIHTLTKLTLTNRVISQSVCQPLSAATVIHEDLRNSKKVRKKADTRVKDWKPSFVMKGSTTFMTCDRNVNGLTRVFSYLSTCTAEIFSVLLQSCSCFFRPIAVQSQTPTEIGHSCLCFKDTG